MKNEAQIRKRIADMKAANRLPCNCAADGHALDCHIGGMMLVAGISTLEWVLGENPMEERMTEEFAAAAARR